MRLSSNTLTLSFLIVIFSSCNTERKADTDRVIKTLNAELKKERELITRDNVRIYMEFEALKNDPMTKEKAIVVGADAIKVKEACDQLRKAIETSKNEPKTNWASLTNKLKISVAAIKQIDSSFKKIFPDEIEQLYGCVDSAKQSVSLLDNNSTARISMLEKILSQLSRLENNLISYSRSRISDYRGDWFSVDGVLVGQNTNHLRKGDNLTIAAGVGAYSSKAKPEISIDGKLVAAADGQGKATMKINETPGKHTKLVKIKFEGIDGIPQSFKVNVEYTVDKDQ